MHGYELCVHEFELCVDEKKNPPNIEQFGVRLPSAAMLSLCVHLLYKLQQHILPQVISILWSCILHPVHHPLSLSAFIELCILLYLYSCSVIVFPTVLNLTNSFSFSLFQCVFFLQEQSHKSYRPLCVLTFRWNYLIHGLEPYGYHLVNILLHLVVSLLYFR